MTEWGVRPGAAGLHHEVQAERGVVRPRAAPPVQLTLGKSMPWYIAAAAGLLFCERCGKQIRQGYLYTKNGEIICDSCMFKEMGVSP